MHDQTFMPQKPLPLIISLKRWREENGFSQSEAVKVLNKAGVAITLDSLQKLGVRASQPAGRCCSRLS
jgi:hypothetical protein